MCFAQGYNVVEVGIESRASRPGVGATAKFYHFILLLLFANI